jgi:hypothetical protein
MLGNAPATALRCNPGGDPAFVPPYDARLLLDTEFSANLPLVPPAPPSRQKGWRASPLWTKQSPASFAVLKQSGAVIGYGLEKPKSGSIIEAGTRGILAQEIRNARGGHYTFTVAVTGEGSSAEEFNSTFLTNMTCRLMLFRFRDTNKDPRKVDELAAVEFQPSFGKTQTFEVDRFLGSKAGGVNFPIGNGLGVAVVIEKKTAGPLRIPGNEVHQACIRLHSVTLEFSPGARHENTIN